MATLEAVKIQNGYKIRGIEPPDLKDYDPSTRLLYWGWVLTLGLKRKDKELAQGLNKDGAPLKAIGKYTREHRRSAMTISGKGDPDAPPLMPAWEKSRTRSLLDGRAFTTHADFFWGYDSYTGDSWGKILDYQAKKGRDVFGLSSAGLAWVKAQSWALWEKWKAGNVRATTRANPKPEVTRQRFPTGRAGIPEIDKGRKPTPNATYGIGTEGPRKGHGGRTPAEWDAYFRSLNRPRSGGGGSTAVQTLPKSPAGDEKFGFPFFWRKSPDQRPKPPTAPKENWDKVIAEGKVVAKHIEESPLKHTVDEIAKLETADEIGAKRKVLVAQVTELHERSMALLKSNQVDEYLKVSKKLKALRERVAENQKQEDQQASKVRAQLVDLIRVSSPAEALKIEHKSAPSVEPKLADSVKSAAEWAAAVFGKDTGGVAHTAQWAQLDPAKGWRAGYDSKTKEITLPADANVALALHELAHYLEENLTGVEGPVRAFLAHRVGNEELKKLNELFPGKGYNAFETGRKDEFDKAFGERAGWYVGKHYSRGTEVLTMGIQKLYEDPIDFARSDPEFVAFLLGIMDGSLRSK